jgi:excisionase family DNA binding protein
MFRGEALAEKLITTAVVANWLGISARTVCLWAECNEIPARKVGRQWRFKEAEIRQWLRRREKQTGFFSLNKSVAASMT